MNRHLHLLAALLLGGALTAFALSPAVAHGPNDCPALECPVPPPCAPTPEQLAEVEAMKAQVQALGAK